MKPQALKEKLTDWLENWADWYIHDPYADEITIGCIIAVLGAIVLAVVI